MKSRLGLALLALVVSLGVWSIESSAQEAPLFGKYQFHIRDGILMRGTSAFVLYAVREPELLAANASWETAIRTLNRITQVGANTVCFELGDLAAFAAEAEPDAVPRLKTLMEQVTWRRLGAICRISGKTEWHSPGSYQDALRRAALALRELNTAIFWLDEPDCGEAVRVFADTAPELITAAAEGAPIRVISYRTGDPIPDPAGGCILLNGGLPDVSGDGVVHFMVSGNDDNYAAIDRAMALPIESEPWIPDNSALSQEERDAGWIALFDGKTLDGWAVLGPNKNGFQVEDGAIVRAETGGSVLRTRDRYDNFVLRLEWKINPGGNSGIFLRAPRTGRASKIGIEFQIMGDSGAPVGKYSTGAIYDVLAPQQNAARPEGEWNELEIVADGPRFRAVLNGIVVQDVDFDSHDELRCRLRNGFIGLQDHGHPAAFRRIRIRPL